MKLWKTGESKTHKEIENFTEESKKLEQELLPFDILGNIAHCEMLGKQGYLTEEELSKIKKELKKLYKEQPTVEGEDVHTFVENQITKHTEAGKKLHTGRSRNDQIVLDTRLYMKKNAIETALETIELVKAIEEFAEKQNKMIPGYTHQQQAMPSSTGLWASSFADSLIDDLKLLKSVYNLLDQNPLGGAASYGTSLNIDRKETTELLGFNEIQENPIYASGSRGKQELLLIHSLDQIMLDLQKIAEDMINLSEDQQIFEIPEKFCTGSSIMPQKKNPDTLELIRAKAEEVHSQGETIHGFISKLSSGYNRDTQQTKKHLIEGLNTTNSCIYMMKSIFESLETTDKFKMKNEIHAAFTANQKVEDGKAFREAYREVKEKKEYMKKAEVPEPVCQDLGEIEKFWNNQNQEWEKMEKKLVT